MMTEPAPHAPDPFEHARAYAALGLRVVPIRHGTKFPPLPEWQKAATADERIIASWWTGLYRDHGVGIATGPGSGVWVLDVDVADGKVGDETLAELEDQHGPLPRTWEAITGTRGTHYFWRFDLERPVRNNQSGLLGAGLDVRGDGGQVVAAPTVHANGTTYAWAPGRAPWETELADAPPWLYDLLEADTARPAPDPRSMDHGSSGAAGAGARPRPSAGDDGDSIAAWFNTTTTWPQLLERDGWTLVKRLGNGEEQWARPGKNPRDGHSATVGHGGGDQLYVFTTSIAELEPEKGYSRFGYEAATRWHGDRSAFARHLREQRNGPRANPADLAWIDATHTPAVAAGTPSSSTSSPLNLPDAFWTDRPILEHIRQAAHHRNRSADAVLHTVLARIASQLPHALDLPAIVGGRGSLNYYTALIGPSGAGKTTAVRVANELTPPRRDLDISDGLPLGSGEGIAEAYMGEVDEVDERGKTRKVRAQIRHNAFVYADEGEALVEMRSRQGTTVMEALRRGWSGSTLGQANASTDRRRIIPDGTYSLGFVIGFQPSKAGALLADHVGGTPQRFVWAAAVDPSIPDTPPDWPGPLPWTPPHLTRCLVDPGTGIARQSLVVHPDIELEIRTTDRDRARGTIAVDELDAHSLLHKLKIAGLFAVLDGRLDVNLDDWLLADQVWATSSAVRLSVATVVRAEAAAVEQAAVERHARRELAAEAARQTAPRQVATYGRRIARWAHEHAVEGVARRDLHARLAGSEKPFFDAALEHAVEHEWLVERDGRWFPGASRPA